MSDAAADDGPITCAVSESFGDWLRGAAGSLVVTTYQGGKVALIGAAGGQVTMHLCDYPRPMGVAVAGDRLALAVRHQVIQFRDSPEVAAAFPAFGTDGNPAGDVPGGYDACFLPRTTHHVGPLDGHDLAYGSDGLWLVATNYGCLARLSDDYSFVPHWAPPFLTALVPEDRCHLNGLAVLYGQPKYVTALGATDTPRGWRDNKAAGGILMDVPDGRILLKGLAMPHSPRWHDGRLWFLNSAAGELCVTDPGSPRYAVAALLPGFLRGLCFVGDHAVVGLCQLRASRTFGALPLEYRFPALKCGVAVVHLRTGETAAMFEFTGGCTELYDVQFLPGVARPLLLNESQMAKIHPVTAPNHAALVTVKD